MFSCLSTDLRGRVAVATEATPRPFVEAVVCGPYAEVQSRLGPHEAGTCKTLDVIRQSSFRFAPADVWA